jgi:hypothetical protein
MKTEQTAGTDPALGKVMAEWQVAAALPPRFEERVWQRIAREQAPAPVSLWSELMARLGAAMLRPSLAVSYVTVLLAGGLLAGYWHARVDNARASQQLESRYVRMVAAYETSPR